MATLFPIGSRVAKNPARWVQNDFDGWDRGRGVGVVVEPPFSMRDGELDVRWPAGRCFAAASGLLPAPTDFEIEVLEHILDDYESVDTIAADCFREIGPNATRAKVAYALLRLAQTGFARAFIYNKQQNAFTMVVDMEKESVEAVWFLASDGGKALASSAT